MKKLIHTVFKSIGYDIRKISKQKVELIPTSVLEELKQKASQYSPLKLHVGCGPRILKGWINIDLSYAHYGPYLQYYTDSHYPPNIRGGMDDFFALNMTQTQLPLEDNSVDLIFHEDFIEHLSQKDQFLFLAETYRVLKKDTGIHRINTPDLVESMKMSNFDKGLVGVNQQEWTAHSHINVLSRANLEEMARIVGYSKVIFQSKNKSLSSLIPLEYRPDPKDRPESGNIFIDLIK